MIDPSQPAFSELHIHHFKTDAEGKEQSAVVPRWQSGLTKREYFAAVAMQGMIARSHGLYVTTTQFAEQSVKLADALIAELSK